MFSTFKTRCKIRYSPKKLGGDYISNRWWMIGDCDPVIGEYYRSLVYIGLYRCTKVNRPLWDCHISIVRNEEPPLEKQCLWHKYDDKEIEVEYLPRVDTDGMFFWLSVESKELTDMRVELGLSPKPIYPFHITIGNLK